MGDSQDCSDIINSSLIILLVHQSKELCLTHTDTVREERPLKQNNLCHKSEERTGCYALHAPAMSNAAVHYPWISMDS